MPISEVHNIDCMEYMRTLPDGFFDLAYPDCPYGIKEDGRKTKGRAVKKDGSFLYKIDKRNGRRVMIKPKKYHHGDWDNNTPAAEYFELLLAKSANQIVFGANYFPFFGDPFKSPRRDKYDDFIKLNPKGWIIWDKVNGTSDFNDCELIWTSFDIPTFVYYYMWAGFKQGESAINGKKMQGNNKLRENRIHPCHKPTILYQWLLHTYAKPNDKIFDSHMGSQSSRIAAWRMGFDYYGCELDAEYFAAGNKRFENEKMIGNLFAPEQKEIIKQTALQL